MGVCAEMAEAPNAAEGRAVKGVIRDLCGIEIQDVNMPTNLVVNISTNLDQTVRRTEEVFSPTALSALQAGIATHITTEEHARRIVQPYEQQTTKTYVPFGRS